MKTEDELIKITKEVSALLDKHTCSVLDAVTVLEMQKMFLYSQTS